MRSVQSIERRFNSVALNKLPLGHQIDPETDSPIMSSSDTAGEPLWRRFEKRVCEQCEIMFPGSTILLDEKIMGRDSGIARQIDIVVRGSFGPHDLLTIIECKDYKDPVDVGTMSEFVTLRHDVQAHLGIIVSKAGFSEAALTLAKNSLVTAYQYADEEVAILPDWAWSAIVFDALWLKDIALTLLNADGTQETMDFKKPYLGDGFRFDPSQIRNVLREMIQTHLRERSLENQDLTAICKISLPEPFGDRRFQIKGRIERMRVFRRAKLKFSGFADKNSLAAYSNEFMVEASGAPVILGPEEKIPQGHDGLSLDVQMALVDWPGSGDKEMFDAFLSGIPSFSLGMKELYKWSLPSC